MPKIAALILTAILVNGAFALTSGPAMPEYNDFESVDNTDLVNLATGDMAYTIPVMTVPGPGLGFPIVLNYHAGIQPEQEASWVGLGWNLEAGAITRQVNDVPDDFKGVLVEERLGDSHVYGWMASISWNGATVGISWDSEVGLGGMVGYSYSFGGKNGGASIGGTIGVNGVYEGVGITAGVGMGKALGDNSSVTAGLSIGLHSKTGVTAGIGAGVSLTSTVGTGEDAIHTSASLASVGASLSSTKGINAGVNSGVGFSAKNTVAGQVTTHSAGAWIPIWTPWTGYIELNWGEWDYYLDGFQEDRYYGFLYSDSKGMNCSEDPPGTPQDPTKCYQSQLVGDIYTRCVHCLSGTRRNKKMDFNNSGSYLKVPDESSNDLFKLGYTGEDIYSVQTQGISGTFKPYRAEDGDYYSYISNQDYTYQSSCDIPGGSWAGINCDRHGTIDYGKYFEGGVTGVESRNYHTALNSEASKIVWRFNEEMGGGLYTDPLYRDDAPKVASGSKIIKPVFSGNEIKGWVITRPDGVRYQYGKALYNMVQQTIGAASPTSESQTRRETPNYAYAWLLTGILSTDYVAIGQTGRECIEGSDVCQPKDGDLGGWIRFEYTPEQTVTWKSSLSSQGMDVESFHPHLTPSGYSASMGFKTVSYLSKIVSPTHEAIMDIAQESRKDGIPPELGEIGFPLQDIPEPLPEDPQHPIDPETCNEFHPASVPRFKYKLLIPKSLLPAGTNVTLVGRGPAVWSKWEGTGPWYDFHYARTCQLGTKDHVIFSGVLPAATGDAYEIYTNETTILFSVRIVIGSFNPEVEANRLAFLKGISLKSKILGGTAQEVGAVRFAYDYSLAQGTPNSESSKPVGDNGDAGRLTLKAVQTGASSQGPWAPAYTFKYYGTSEGDGTEKRYDKRLVDFWGYYCSHCDVGKRRPDGNASAWDLKSITNPSGSTIEVTYEAKTAEYVEGVPFIIPGSSIGQYLKVDNAHFSWSEDFRRATFNDPNYIPTEIASSFSGKYVVFLGKVDGLPFTGSLADSYVLPLEQNYDFTYIQDIHATSKTTGLAISPSYVLEVPSRRDEGGVFGHLEDDGNVHFPTSRAGSQTFWATLGTRSAVPFGDLDILRNSPSIPIKARLWAVFDQEPVLKNYQGGVRVSGVKFTEPFTGKTNQVQYTYSEAATPTLPDPMSNYELGLRYRNADGLKSYLGNPSIIHGKVNVSYVVNGSSAYSSDYFFVTSQDLPTRIGFQKVPNYAYGDELQTRVKILDRSGLWGSLWKKTDNNASAPVKTTSTFWASRISDAWKTKLNIPTSEDLGLIKDSHPVLQQNDEAVKVFTQSEDERTYFGMTQKLWSNRFIPGECDIIDDGQDRDDCLVSKHGAHSAQVEMVRFLPLRRTEEVLQDGVKNTSESNLFDFRTGTSLLQISCNWAPDGSKEFYASLAMPAYSQTGTDYVLMKARNMLEQTFSKTTFRFIADPAGKDFTQLPQSDLNKVVASEITAWKNLPHAATGTDRIRQTESFSLKNAAGFQLPVPGSISGSLWQSQGAVTEYDDFGNTLEFNAPDNTFNSQLFGYKHSLPTVFAQNALRKEIFTRSFEAAEETEGILSASAFYEFSGKRSKTGSASIKVKNCKETTGKCAGSADNTMICYDLGNLPTQQTYIASAWYYDEYKGSNPDNPMDATYWDALTHVTRPGIFIGDEARPAGCHEESHPNGAVTYPDGTGVVPPASNGAKNANQRALGERNWKRISVEFSPQNSCGTNGVLDKAWLCLYASKGKSGSDVYYDEVRVRPKNSLMSTYTYGVSGKMSSSTDANEVVTRYEYDAFGNLTGMRNDDGKLLSEQAKKYGEQEAQFTLIRRGIYHFGNLPDDGCENIDIISSVPGVDNSFTQPLIEPATAATFKMKEDANGNKQPSLCYDTYASFQFKVIMSSTGKQQVFDIPSRVINPLQVNGCSKSDNPKYLSQLTAADAEKCLEVAFRATDNFFPINNSKPAYVGVYLPMQAQLRNEGRIANQDVLTGYRIRISFPAGIEPGLASGVNNNPSQYPFHVRMNFFDDIGFGFRFSGNQEVTDPPETRVLNQDYVMVPGGYSSLKKAFAIEYDRPLSHPFSVHELGPISKNLDTPITAGNYFAFGLYANGNPGGAGLWPMRMIQGQSMDKIGSILITVTPLTEHPPQ